MAMFETVRQATVDAIREAMREACQMVGRASLFGFAICTHDDVDSVYHVYATREWVRDHEIDYPGIGFIAVEWTQSSSDDLFEPLSRVFRDWAEAQTDYQVDRADRFRAIVEAMKICRDEGIFDAGTLLTVGSTDPDDQMEALDRAAARLLNSEELFHAYSKVMDG